MLKKLKEFSRLTFHNKIRTIAFQLHLFKTIVVYRWFFERIGKNSRIIKPLKLINPQHITIGNNVSIHHLGWLLTLQINEQPPRLIIDDGACIGHFSHITSVNKVYIGKNVLAADRLYVSDHIHEYRDINTPIINHPILCKGEVYIGDDSWIGENVSIISCRIGKHCVVGANSVVTKDIPDYSVAVGVPARVIKKYSFETQKWENIKESNL